MNTIIDVYNIIDKEVKLLPEMIYDAVLDYDAENGVLQDHIFFSKDDIPEDAQKLYTYFDMSTTLFLTQCPNILQIIVKYVREKLYEDMRYIDYEDGRPTIKYYNWYYTFYDKADMKTEYHREKNIITGEEIDYVRIIFSIVAKINKGE